MIPLVPDSRLIAPIDVTFCITCCDKDVHLLDQCVSYIDNQTVKPEEVVIVCSGLKDESILLLEKVQELNFERKDTGYVVYNSPYRKLPGWARNIGGVISTGEVVVFCDVDDSIHPQKCQFIKGVFQNKEVSAIVGNYHLPGSFDGWKDLALQYEEITEVEPDPYPVPAGWFNIPRVNVMAPSKKPIAHGHMSCRTELFTKNQVTYKEDMPLGEDGTFCRSILAHSDYRLFYTPQKLIIYN